MEIDNSAANAFRTCPLMYFETYLAEGTGLELKSEDGKIGPYDVGSRTHELLEEYYNEMKGTPIQPYSPSENERVETECQMIIAAYRAKYPVENFEIADVEKAFKVELPINIGGYESTHKHIYTGKIDLVFRQDGKLNIMDAKTERRRSSGNHPKKWAARDQASLYLWAAARIYGEKIENFYVNVLTRPSDKLQEGPIFPERQKLERTPEQLEIAVRDIVVIADEIERYKAMFKNNLWPSNRENCTEGTWGDCEFYLSHTYGWSQDIRDLKYRPKEDYQKLGGIQVIQP